MSRMQRRVVSPSTRLADPSVNHSDPVLLGRLDFGVSRHICRRDHWVRRRAAGHDAFMEFTSPIRSTR